MRRVGLVGATGSIGRQTLEVVARHADRLRVVALAAGSRWREVAALARRCRAEAVALADAAAAARARAELAGSGIAVLAGADGVAEVAAWPTVDVSVIAPTGVAGLQPVLAALAAGKDVALANKESLVAGGRLVTRAAAAGGGRVLPVDSEHSAIFQCVHARGAAGIRRLWLTASGGPFRAWPLGRLAAATPAQALGHPVWSMGPRVTVDSATLFNKGLETVEATWLFGVAAAAVEVLVHPQSVVHSLVEFVDGALLAQCAAPDMRLPILYALSHPERWDWPEAPRLDLAALGRLDFEPPDLERFPCLGLARAAAAAGGTAPAALNAADEVAVDRFLRGEIRFTDIARVLAEVLEGHAGAADDELGAVLAADAEGRARAREWRPRSVRPAAAPRADPGGRDAVGEAGGGGRPVALAGQGVGPGMGDGLPPGRDLAGPAAGGGLAP